MHIFLATVRMGHIAREDYVFPVPADGCVRLRPESVRASRPRVRQTVNNPSIDACKHDFVLVELPIAFRWLLRVFLVEELGAWLSLIEKRERNPRLRRPSSIADMPRRHMVQQTHPRQ